MRYAVLVCLLLAMSLGYSATSEDASLFRLLKSRHFRSVAVPEQWQPAVMPQTEKRVEPFLAFNLGAEGISIPQFIGHFGKPTRYLVSDTTKLPNYILYDLPSGHLVALQVHSPPSNTFAAIVVMDATGHWVSLIK
jgi:hypothetical protein